MTSTIMTPSTILIASLVILSVLNAQCSRHNGFSMIEITPLDCRQISALNLFAKSYVNEENEFQFVRSPYKVNTVVAVIVSPTTRKRLEDMLAKESMEYRVVIEDYQKLIDRENRDNQRALVRGLLRRVPKSDHVAYLRYKQIEEWIIRKIERVPYAKLFRIGKTVENRELFMIKISKNSSLPIVWIDGGIHAREWISVSSVLYVVDSLLQNTSVAAEKLSSFQFLVVPVVNPDGYEYSHDVYRLWRKNRSQSNTSACYGVDLNRNFPYDWKGASSSTYPCSDQYKGESEASELETRIIVREMTRVKDHLLLVVCVHAYGQLILQPFHYSSDHFPRNYLDMTSVAIRAAYNVENKRGTRYRVGRGPDILYSVSGSANDFAVGSLQIPFSFTVELPDRGNHGFILPPDFIRPVGQELWDIILSLTTDLSKLVAH